MKVRNNNKLPATRTYCAFMLLIIFLLYGIPGFAQSVKKKKKQEHYEAGARFATIYDNNILKYSDKYLDRFMNGQDFGRFHIKTYDDIILYAGADITATYRLIKDLKSEFDINFFSNSYMLNNIKNWYFIGFGYRQYISKRASFKVFYEYIPHYYVRHFRDADWVDVYGYTPETFVQFAYSKDNIGFWVQNYFFKNTRVRLDFDYSQYYHNKHYTEYDCKDYHIGGRLYQPVHKKVNLEFGYEYIYSNAKGYDEPGETKETSDDADATHFENDFIFGVNVDLPKMKKVKHEADIRLVYENRQYLSEHYLEEDPEHTGRIDNNIQFSANYTVDLNKSFSLSGFYRFNFRNSTSVSPVNELYLSGEKDYDQSQIGFQVTYNISF